MLTWTERKPSTARRRLATEAAQEAQDIPVISISASTSSSSAIAYAGAAEALESAIAPRTSSDRRALEQRWDREFQSRLLPSPPHRRPPPPKWRPRRIHSYRYGIERPVGQSQCDFAELWEKETFTGKQFCFWIVRIMRALLLLKRSIAVHPQRSSL